VGLPIGAGMQTTRVPNTIKGKKYDDLTKRYESLRVCCPNLVSVKEKGLKIPRCSCFWRENAPSEALAREIQDFVKVQLAAHEYPRYLQVADTLPMTATGKVLLRELRALM
jgi:non-ribosomal peptide synthetase component E (peptide arylation enzyme)